MNVMAMWLEFQACLYEEMKPKDGISPAGLSEIGMFKSELLGRLMRGESIREKPCPKHAGKMWCGWVSTDQFIPCECEGTGWLPDEEA